jgi:tight adherence protein B
MRRLVRRAALVASVALAAAALVGSSGAAATDSGVGLVEAQGPAFPVRTYVVTLPTGRGLTIHGVHVTENGGPVVDPTLVPASKASPKTFGVVLVRDTSFSMAGKPLAGALAAEQAFVAQRNKNEQLGAIDFNTKSTTVLPLTTSQAKINAALAKQPNISGGTHIFDAVHQAESMLKVAHISSGSIVVLSDGADTGSKKTLDEVAHTAVGKNIRIYTIGLSDAQFNPATLQALAAAGHGEYAQAKAGAALTQLFNNLGQTLSNEYLLQYKSLAKPNVPVHVEVSVNGVGSATTPYRTPPLEVSQHLTPTYSQSFGSRIWSSTITMLLLVLLVVAAIGLLVFALVQPRRTGLPARMAEFVSIRELQKDKKTPAAVAAAAAEAGIPEDQRSAWQQFADVLEIAGIKASRETIVAGTIAGTVLAFFFLVAVTGSLWWGLFALLVPYAVREWVIRTLKRRRYRFAEQLPDALDVIASALRSGQSLGGALAVVVEGGSEPMKSELQRVVADEQLGIPIQDSLLVVARRMASTDVEQLALVAELQREAGGNVAEVVELVSDTVRERFDLRRLISTLTMQGRMSRWIVTALPVAIILLLQIESPHYLHPLFATTGGRILFGLAAALAVAGSLIIKRIVEIEV